MQAVKDFMQMIGYGAAEITDATAIDFTRNLSEQKDAGQTVAAVVTGIFDKIKKISTISNWSMIKTGIKGSYGEFFACLINSKHCFKQVTFGNDSEKYQFIKELFIQFILSKDPDVGKNIPAIFGIYYKGDATKNTIIVEMKKATKNIVNFINDLPPPKRMTFPIFRNITQKIFTIVRQLYERYRFVHRDFKADNIMLNKVGPGPQVTLDNSDIQIIDFGMSCITITLNGQQFNIICGAAYHHGVPCMEQQDISVYLYYILNVIAMDAETREFINNFLTPPFKAKLVSREVGRPEVGHPVHTAYNMRGNLFEADNLPRFTIDALLGALQGPPGGNEGGGRKTKRRNGKKLKKTRRR